MALEITSEGMEGGTLRSSLVEYSQAVAIKCSMNKVLRLVLSQQVPLNINCFTFSVEL